MFGSTLHDSTTVAMTSPKFDGSFYTARRDDTYAIRKRAAGRVILISQAHVLRAQTEACIREVYEKYFGAKELEFPGTLLACVDDDDKPLCAAGLRTGGEGFFSEAYLDGPIEIVLSARLEKPVTRGAVFEVTTLASRNAAVCPAFLRRLVAVGKSAGYEWSFFTATKRLRNLLRHLGIPILELCPADPRRLSNPERWGTYYAHSPMVCAVNGRWLERGAARQEGAPPDA